MSIPQKCYGIIPARYASTRFPGKPLADINGKPMIWHVYQRARRCIHLDEVAVATDDQRIEQTARSLNIPVVMTRNDHISGSDRVLEAAIKLNAPENSVIVNIQGDEPALHPDMLSELVRPFSDANIQATTLVRVIDAPSAQSPDVVKVTLDRNSNALYFSRAPIPYPRDKDAWDFLFPQRGGEIPHYEIWVPKYTDYLFIAFTTSIAFSPTDTLPLTRRAKILMMLQAGVSLVTITAIASSAINIMAGGA